MAVTWADVSALDPALATIPVASRTAIPGRGSYRLADYVGGPDRPGVGTWPRTSGRLYLHGQSNSRGLAEE